MKKILLALVLSSTFIFFCFGIVAAFNISNVRDTQNRNPEFNFLLNSLRAETISLSSNSIEENQPTGAPIGLFEIEGYSQTYTCDLSAGTGDSDNNVFTISDNQLLSAEEFDYEYKSSYSIYVSCSGIDLHLEQSFSISVTNVYDITLSNNFVEDNTPSGTYVGDLGMDNDYSQITTCIINDGIGDYLSFYISGERELFTSEDINYEMKNLYSISVSCSGYGMSISPYNNKIIIPVIDVNVPPSFTSTPNIQATQGILYTYNISASDPDFGDIVTITVNEKPDWLSFSDNGNGAAILTGTPGNDHVGENSVELLAMDVDGLSCSQDFIINVENANDPPIFTSTALVDATEGQLYSYTIYADDPDLVYGETLTITAPTLPEWISFSQVLNQVATLMGVPDNSDVGDHAVELLITDSEGANATQSFTISVEQVNDPPVFTSTPVTTAKQNCLYTYNIVVLDPDQDDTIEIISIILPDWLLLTDYEDGTGLLSGTPGESDIEENDVVLKTIDKAGEFDFQVFTIIVSEDSLSLFLPLIRN